jgi:phage baseplate assembly protein gpV
MTLLEETDTRRRVLQQILVLAGGALVVAGLAACAFVHGAARGLSLAAVVAGAALIVAASRVLVRWEVPYEGHIIRFENSVVFGERLIIDGERITRGALGYSKVLEGTIKRGSRAGQTSRAESEAGVIRFRCKLTVEPA